MSPVLSSHVVRVALLVLGLVTLMGLVVHIGPDRIYRAGASLGAVGVAVMLLPSTVMYLLDCLGWRFTLGQYAVAVPFSQLFVIRTAGELVNATTPTAYLGGEPLKAHLLKQYSIPIVESLASVIVAKTTMTIAQIVYILLGIGLGVWMLFPSRSTPADTASILAATLSVTLLLFGTALFILIQRRGLFTVLFGTLERCRIRVAALETRRERLLALDESSMGAAYPGSKPALAMGHHPVAWTFDRATSRVFYTSMGHTDESWSEPAFLEMLVRAVEWTSETRIQR